LAQAGWPADRILDSLIADDIRQAADLFRPVYEESQGGDGFVSLEVHPALADQTEATLEEARRLWTLLNRPNVMIKIPATQAGIPAVRQAISEGINVNITLIFSLRRYAEVIEAYLAGLEERRANGRALDHIASVASFFVSRVDSEVDERLDGIIRREDASAERAASLRGQAAIANAQLAYAQFQAAFASDRFHALETSGARVQRPLWASTSTKNPAYPDTYYIDNLIGPQTVNTLPMKTLEAFLDHGQPSVTLGENLSKARSRLEALASVGVPMDEVTDLLERQGVKKFTDSFVSLLKTVEGRAASARREIEGIQPRLRSALDQLDHDDAGRRLWPLAGGSPIVAGMARPSREDCRSKRVARGLCPGCRGRWVHGRRRARHGGLVAGGGRPGALEREGCRAERFRPRYGRSVGSPGTGPVDAPTADHRRQQERHDGGAALADGVLPGGQGCAGRGVCRDHRSRHPARSARRGT
jgi:transaldolase